MLQEPIFSAFYQMETFRLLYSLSDFQHFLKINKYIKPPLEFPIIWKSDFLALIASLRHDILFR